MMATGNCHHAFRQSADNLEQILCFDDDFAGLLDFAGDFGAHAFFHIVGSDAAASLFLTGALKQYTLDGGRGIFDGGDARGGRYGGDQLNRFILMAALVLLFISALFQVGGWWIAGVVLNVFELFLAVGIITAGTSDKIAVPTFCNTCHCYLLS